MAMMPPHYAAPLLLIVLAVSIAGAAAAGAAASDSLRKACSVTTLAATCAEWLGPIPEASTATPRRLALLALNTVAKEGAALSKEMEIAVKKPEEAKNAPCLKEAQGNLMYYAGTVAKLEPEQGEFKFTEAKDKLSAMLEVPSSSRSSCSDINEPVIKKVLTYEDRVVVTSDLMNKA